MATIKNIEIVYNIYKDWSPNSVAFIKEVHWVSGDLVMTCYCQVRGKKYQWPDFIENFFAMRIIFKDIESFELKINSELQQITGFDILDISDRGFEKINFEIEDYEDNVIRFCCRDIEILQVSDPFLI